jgi:hypothetical protein
MRKHSDEDSDSNINTGSTPDLIMTGGFTGRDVGGEGDLEEGEEEAYKFIEGSLDSIQEYDLYHVREQVVAGMNYCFSFKAKDSHNFD